MIYPLKINVMKKNLNLPKKKTGRLRNLFLTVCLLASVAASAQEKQ